MLYFCKEQTFKKFYKKQLKFKPIPTICSIIEDN